MVKTPFEGSGTDWVSFDCDWRPEGVGAASVRVSGEVDRTTSLKLEGILDEALRHARMVLLNMHEVSFMAPRGVQVIATASEQVRKAGGYLIVVGASVEIDALFELSRVRAQPHVLRLATTGQPSGEDRLEAPQSANAGDDAERSTDPLDNPVNASVLVARVMQVPEQGLWFQDADTVVRQAWAPQAAAFPPVPAGTKIEAYLDHRGEINGWWDPNSGLASNQRHLNPGTDPKATWVAVCHGACELVWQAPAAARLVEHDEQCLTCAGPLALG